MILHYTNIKTNPLSKDQNLYSCELQQTAERPDRQRLYKDIVNKEL
jgi:hypothetical protein